MKKQITFILIVLCGAVSFLNAQYKKKVVSYVNNVLVPPNAGLSSRHTDYIASAISKNIQMERFNYVSLPDNVVSQFSIEASRLSTFTSEKVRPLIEKTLAPKFLELLDINKELLSEQNMTEVERNTFLATKAQSAGLSALQLEAILNSGFFYVPYVEYYGRSVDKGERLIMNDEGKVVRKVPTITISSEIKAGLLWFQLKVDKANNATVQFIGAANGWKGSGIERSATKDADDGEDIDWKTFAEAVQTSAINIGIETKKIEQFKLTGTVSETTTFGVKLNLGTREGVGLDDSYWIEELEETESGDIVKSRRGFVKIREIGNNKRDEFATSYAQTISGTNYSPGLNVTEIPLLGVNGVIGFGKIPLHISEFNKINPYNKTFGLSEADLDFAVSINSEVKDAYGPMASLQVDLANSTKISELWLQLCGALGFLDVDGKFYLRKPAPPQSSQAYTIDSTNNIGFSLSGYGSLGLLKKFYFRRFGMILQTDLKYSVTQFSVTGKDKNNDDLDYTMTHGSIGFAGKAGMEVYLTPVFSIGGGVEYTAAALSNSWSVTVTDKDKNETNKPDAIGPDVKYSGLGWFVWINYSLPSFN